MNTPWNIRELSYFQYSVKDLPIVYVFPSNSLSPSDSLQSKSCSVWEHFLELQEVTLAVAKYVNARAIKFSLPMRNGPVHLWRDAVLWFWNCIYTYIYNIYILLYIIIYLRIYIHVCIYIYIYNLFLSAGKDFLLSCTVVEHTLNTEV